MGHQARHETAHDEDEEDETHRDQGESQDLRADRHRPRRSVDQILLQLAGLDQTIVFDRVLVLELLQRHAAGEHDDVEREFVRSEVIVEEVDREQESGGEHRFLAVRDHGDVEHPAGQERRGDVGEPEHESAQADDGDAPERRPVVELLPVGPAVEPRPRAEAEEPLEHGEGIPQILEPRDHRIRAEEVEGPPLLADAHDHVDQVREEHEHEHAGADAVDVGGGLRAAENLDDVGRPEAVGIERCHAGQHQRHQADRECQMRDPPDRRPAAEVFLRLGGKLVGQDVRAHHLLLALAVLAIEPQRRMRPEERKGAAEQPQHEFRRDPGERIAGEIVRIGVRLERHIAGGRLRMALLTGLETIVRVNRRGRIIDPLDGVAAVAVEALGGVGEAERVDLAVIGLGVALEALVMAIAAVLGDGQLGRILGRVRDVVGRVAVGADCRARVLVFQHFLAVHRGPVQLALLGVALAAGVRDVQAPFGADRAARRIDVVGVVAAVAARVGARLVVPVRLRVNRLHEAVDLLDHHAQPLEFLGLVLDLRLVPQVLMTLHAADLDLDLLVRDLGDVGVAVDAHPLAVHALFELILGHVQIAHLAVGARHGEAFGAVTAQAGGVVRTRSCRLRLRFPATGRTRDANDGG